MSQLSQVEVHQGVTRTVLLLGPWALKVPGGMGRCYVRGWLANRSEWRQRRRRRVAPCVLTLAHVILVMRRAERVGVQQEQGPWTTGRGDKGKASSWGWFGDRWLMIDYDLSWRVDRGIIGSLYFGWQEVRWGGAPWKTVLPACFRS